MGPPMRPRPMHAMRIFTSPIPLRHGPSSPRLASFVPSWHRLQRILRHMGRNDLPAIRHPHPGLALATDASGAMVLRFSIRGGKVPAECRDHGVAQGAFDAVDLPPMAKR